MRMAMMAEGRLVARKVEEGVGCTVTEDATAAAAAVRAGGSSFPHCEGQDKMAYTQCQGT